MAIKFGPATSAEKAKGIIATAQIPAGTTLTPEVVHQAVEEHIHPKFAPVEITVPARVTRTKAFKTLEAEGIVRKVGRPPSGKIVTTMRLDPDVIEALKAQGDGWQARANALLRTALGL